MNLRRILVMACVCLCGAVAGATAPKGGPAARPRPAKSAAATVAPRSQAGADSAGYLPDSAVIARVDDRVISAYDFRERYFASDAETRPSTDRDGRLEFLNHLIDKEVMGLTALSSGLSLTSDERQQLREDTDTALQNGLYQRLITDSIAVTEQEIQDVYRQYGYEQRLQRVVFRDRSTAERVRRDLIARRIRWEEAFLRYSPAAGDTSRDGELGWIKRNGVSGAIALTAFALEPGRISDVLHDADAYVLIRCVERRPVDAAPLVAVRRSIAMDLRTAKQGPRVQRMFDLARASAAVVYDTTNIGWAVSRFLAMPAPRLDPNTVTIDMTSKVPSFSPADTGRVLARTRDGRLTLGQFIAGYTAVSPALRRRIRGVDSFLFMLDAMVLKPEMIKLALARGIDKDPDTAALIEKRREEKLVEHLFEDSVLSRISVKPEERREYYRKHEHEFVSVPRVRYAQMLRKSAGAADSLIARLKAGASAEAIVRADSLIGGPHIVASIREVSGSEPNEYKTILFDELKPGQSTRLGPDSQGSYLVLHVLSHQDERQLAYEEVASIVAESVQNIHAEELLNQFLARHRREHRIESHPDWVMRIRLINPVFD